MRAYFGTGGAAETDAVPFECSRVTDGAGRETAAAGPTLEAIECVTSTAMGAATASPHVARHRKLGPFIGMLSEPQQVPVKFTVDDDSGVVTFTLAR